MGWCSATSAIDAAIEGAERAIAAAWQIASDNEHAKTPAYANALTTRPELRDQLDDVLRPFVAAIAEKLREGDWDCQHDSRYFGRFRQEMLGHSHAEMVAWYGGYLKDPDDWNLTPAQVREYADCMAHHLQEARNGAR